MSTATPSGMLSPVETSELTALVAATHSLIALWPASEKYTLPWPSTATPVGAFSPDETKVLTCCVLTLHSLTALLEPSAIYRLPGPSTATPLGLLSPEATSVVTTPIRLEPAPACVTVNVRPDMVSVPVWAVAFGFAP